MVSIAGPPLGGLMVFKEQQQQPSSQFWGHPVWPIFEAPTGQVRRSRLRPLQRHLCGLPKDGGSGKSAPEIGWFLLGFLYQKGGPFGETRFARTWVLCAAGRWRSLESWQTAPWLGLWPLFRNGTLCQCLGNMGNMGTGMSSIFGGCVQPRCSARLVRLFLCQLPLLLACKSEVAACKSSLFGLGPI